jgi:CRP/FNR family cyclic AMP-dependent transcriptional regulator
MTKLNYRRDDIIFREGDPSDFVCRIISGDVEVARELDGKLVVIGVVQAGDFVGEMGVIEGRNRSATVRALGDLSVELIDKDDFLKLISSDSDTSFQLLSRLSERLREANDLILTSTASGPSSPSTVTSGQVVVPGLATEVEEEAPTIFPEGMLTIFAETDDLRDQLPEDGVSITKFPFLIGRQPDEREADLQFSSHMPDVDLQLADAKPYRLSRTHLALQNIDSGRFLIRDLGSALGTQVNDKFLGADFGGDTAELKAGENQVVAGGAESPFVFRVVVKKKAENLKIPAKTQTNSFHLHLVSDST